MRFEVILPENNDQGTLHSAGLDTHAYFERSMEVLLKNAPLPFEVACPYILSEKPVDVQVIRYSHPKGVRLSIEVDDVKIGRDIKKFVHRYSLENNGVAVSEREHNLVWKKIEQILKRDSASYYKLQHGKAVLSRRALESLMRLCNEIESHYKHNIYSLFTDNWVVKADRAFAARWLISQFEVERIYDAFGIRIYELAVPQIADDLIRLIKDRRYGDRRGDLCLALAKTKNSQAVDVIISVLDEDGMALWALDALGKLHATKYVNKVRKFLRHSDADVRREAKKTLKKLGFPVETPPPPVHLVKNRRFLPKGLEE